MKRILAIALMMCVLVMVGCGNSKYSDETVLEERVFWVENEDDIDDFIDGAGRGANGEFDEDFLRQQLAEGRIKFSEKEVKISVVDELRGGKVVEIKFLQGRNKNKIGYVFPEFIRDLKKEREVAKVKQEQNDKAEQVRHEKEQTAYDIGYLKQGTAWEDETGKAHYNAKQVKVEIWKQKIVTGGKGNLIQIYFLEGENTGQWGYVREISLSR